LGVEQSALAGVILGDYLQRMMKSEEYGLKSRLDGANRKKISGSNPVKAVMPYPKPPIFPKFLHK
jgi:hypothetical protein